MQVKVSTVFADFINETSKKTGHEYYAKVITMKDDAYRFVCGSENWMHAHNTGDRHFDGTCKALKIVYPESWYAIPQYITTYDLTQEFRARKVRTEDELILMIDDMLAI